MSYETTEARPPYSRVYRLLLLSLYSLMSNPNTRFTRPGGLEISLESQPNPDPSSNIGYSVAPVRTNGHSDYPAPLNDFRGLGRNSYHHVVPRQSRHHHRYPSDGPKSQIARAINRQRSKAKSTERPHKQLFRTG